MGGTVRWKKLNRTVRYALGPRFNLNLTTHLQYGLLLITCKKKKKKKKKKIQQGSANVSVDSGFPVHYNNSDLKK